MSDALKPKEKLTAYERWELPSFDVHTDIQVSGNPNGIKLPTASELEEIQRQAHDEGYQVGYTEGMQHALIETQKLAALVSSMEHALAEVDQQVAQSLLDLSLELAQQMLRQTLQVKPEILLEIIREAISSLPHFNPSAHLVLHPDDAQLVRERMGEQLAHSGWKIFEDIQISQGGARIETAHSQIDATLETRWKRITTHLGQDSTWLAE